MSVNLVICTYAGTYYKFDNISDNLNDKQYYLRYNLSIINKIKTDITQISIMRPKVDKNHEEIKNYYNFDDLDIDNIRDKIKIYECDNIGISYGQFFNSINKNNEFDYHIFIEDDYVPFKDYFEKDLIMEFNKRTEDGFVCSFIHKDIKFNIFNEMEDENSNTIKYIEDFYIKYNLEKIELSMPDFSLGILSKKSIDKLLNKFESFNSILNIFNIKFNKIYLHQILFGLLLYIADVKIYDTSDVYLNIFYSSFDKNIFICNFDSYVEIRNWKLITYNNKKYDFPLFIPVDIFPPNNYFNDVFLMQNYLKDNVNFVGKLNNMTQVKKNVLERLTNRV